MNLFYFSATKTHCSTTDYLLLPESKKMAGSYCSALCNLSGMCEFFMTIEDTNCPHGCSSKNDISEFMFMLFLILYFLHLKNIDIAVQY